MKKQIALVLAGTAAAIAGGLRLVQELVDRGEGNHAATTSSTVPSAAGSAPGAGTKAAQGEPVKAERAGHAGHAGSGNPAEPDPAKGPAKAPAKASKAELYGIATELEISGRSKMSKPELIEAINRAG